MNPTFRILMLMCVAIAPVVHAQNTEATSNEIAPQILSGALSTFAKQTGLQLIYVSEIAEGQQSKGVPSGLSRSDALKKLLEGTGLSFEFINEHTVRVFAAPTVRPVKSSMSGTRGWVERFRLAQVGQSERDQASQGDQKEDEQGSRKNTVQLEEIIVTAQKREERLQDVPISISVLRGEDLERSTAQGLTEALNRVPGVATAVSYISGGTLVTVRGVTAANALFTGSSPVAYYLDSVPFGLVRTAIAPDANAYDLERAEVLRGPSGGSLSWWSAMQLTRPFTAAVAFGCLTAMLWYASPAGAAPAEVETSTQGVPEITVTARRREERMQDVPVAITALSSEALDAAAASDLIDIAQLIPTMVVGRQVSGSGASIFLRGVGTGTLSSGFDLSVSSVVDGIPMSRGKEIVFSQFDLHQVEVLKGPQALFFGKNSTAGIINVSTADPTDTFETGVKAGYEYEAGEKSVEGFVSGPLSDTVKARFAVRGSTISGPFRNSGAPAVDFFGFQRRPVSSRRGEEDVVSGRLSLGWEPSEQTDWMLKVGATRFESGGPSDLYERKCAGGRTTVERTTDAPADPFTDCEVNGVMDHSTIPAQIANSTPLMREEPFTDNKSYYASLTGAYDFGSMTLTSVTGSYYFSQQDANDVNGSVPDSFIGQDAWYRQFSQEFRLATDFEGRLNTMIGAFYSKGEFFYDVTAVFPTYPPNLAVGDGKYYAFDRRSGFDSDSYSAFAEFRYALADNLELSAGARWSQDERTSYAENVDGAIVYRATFPLRRLDDQFKDSNVSPQATLTWKPSDRVMVYGAYKEGYKTGGFNTSVNITAASTVAGNRFRSETAQGGELGLRTRLLNDQMTVNVTAYQYSYDDLQVVIYDPEAAANRITNAGELRTTGVEGEINWRAPSISGLELYAVAAYNRAVYYDYIGTCYTGQTIAEGCSLLRNAAGTAFTSQDYNGRTAPKAPRSAGRVGLRFPALDANGWRLAVSTELAYSGSYNYTDSLRPDGVQDSYVRYDAGLRLSKDAWELALIGRNLGNEYVITSANDMTGVVGVGGTGTTVGKVSDLMAIVERGRQVYLQLSARF